MMPQITERTLWQKPKIDIAGAENQYQAVNRVMKYWGFTIATAMLRVFVDTAARFTPPNMGHANIEEKYYYRPVQQLSKLAKGEYEPYHATKEDFAAMRAGFRFRVLNTKLGHKKNEVYAYTRGINEAKRVSRIQNRGLARYTWGDALNNHSEEIFQMQAERGGKIVETDLPPIFHRLAKKSPNITKYHFGYAYGSYVRGKDAHVEIGLVNKLTNKQGYATIAVEKGTVAVNRYINKLFGKIKNRLEADVYKLLDDTKLYKVKFK